MKISELIMKLERVKALEGDLDVRQYSSMSHEADFMEPARDVCLVIRLDKTRYVTVE